MMSNSQGTNLKLTIRNLMGEVDPTEPYAFQCRAPVKRGAM
jgi:hypothetical protein